MRIIFFLLLHLTTQSFSQTSVQVIPKFEWMNNKTELLHLRNYIERSAELGLNQEEYDVNFIDTVINDNLDFTNFTDSVASESKLTHIAISFFSDIIYGKQPIITYNGINYIPDCIPLAETINEAVNDRSFNALLNKLECRSPEYVSLKSSLLNLADSLRATPVSDRKRTSIVEKKISSIVNALNTVRWMNCLTERNEYTIVVNVPSASLLLYNRDQIIFESRVIVGKRSTRTPLFVSNLSDVTIYPYWNVPKSIAVKELLPMIKKNIDYLKNNNFQILNANGKVINPYGVDWHSLNATNFPYSIRQSTGCDNSLGLIKLNINHPNNIYLHDTPWKVLFESSNRFYSHGCIRVQKAKELAHIILKENSLAVDTLKENENTTRHQPVILRVDKKIPVLVLYNTAWFNAEGEVRFYSDIYSKFK